MADPTLVLETGAGLTTSNAYASLTEAELILSSRPASFKTLWTAASNYEKEQLLIWSTALLDDWIIWPGFQVSSGQALGFPRFGVTNPDGYSLASYTVPPFVKRATVEMSLALLSENLTEEPARGLDLLKVGPITLDFNSKESEKPRVIPRSVFSILLPFGCRMRLYGTASVGSLPLERA